MDYIVLLRGVNVGGKRKVSMTDLKKQLSDVGFEKVTSYINSGNIIMSSKLDHARTSKAITAVFNHFYEFEIPFIALTIESFQEEYESLPAWWFNDAAYRRNVLFYLPTYAAAGHKLQVTDDEIIHQGKLALFWTVSHSENYSRSYYHKLAKTAIYQQVTIRNGNTFKKLYELTKEYYCLR